MGSYQTTSDHRPDVANIAMADRSQPSTPGSELNPTAVVSTSCGMGKTKHTKRPPPQVEPLRCCADFTHSRHIRGMSRVFKDLRASPWAVETCRYKDTDGLLSALEAKVIAPAEAGRLCAPSWPRGRMQPWSRPT